MTEPGEEIFLSEQHPESRRWTVFEDDETSAWLYLTEPDSQTPIADCWIYNRIIATEPVESYASRGSAPPAPVEMTGEFAVVHRPTSSGIRLQWSSDGEAVALLFNGTLMGFITAQSRRGYSRNLIRSGPWGNPLDETLYRTIFEVTA